MSANNNALSLRSRIRDDYLTCPICFDTFKQPKALPCIHTFCLECLRNFVTSNYPSSSAFPCPVCRSHVTVPAQGLEGLPDNYMVSSLQDTVEESQNKPAVPQRLSDETTETKPKPVPAPRSICPQPRSQERPIPAPRSVSPLPPNGNPTPPVPPRPKSVSPTPVNADNLNPGEPRTEQHKDLTPGYFSNPIQGGIGGIEGAVGSAVSDISSYLHIPQSKPAVDTPMSPFEFVPRSEPEGYSSETHNAGLYPQLKPNENKSPCSDRLVLSFGKFGPGVNDLMKPFGLTVSKTGDFVLSDRGGNRIFVFSNTGELKTRFNTDCIVNGTTITKENNILIAVSKSGSAIMRLYSMEGRCLQVYGDYYKFDISSGITVTPSNHVAITNLAADNVLIFTEQRKFSVKFGWKGKGQNHFSQPRFVTSTSKDYLVVSDTGNHCIKLFDIAGNFKRCFGSNGSNHNQLNTPLGVATDAEDNIIIADSGNFRVEIFTVKGMFYSTLVKETNLIGPDVKPVNVAVTPKNNIAVLLCGTGFCEVRVFNWKPNSCYGFKV